MEREKLSRSYRLLLWILPDDMRGEYGEEMEHTFLERSDMVRGHLARVSFTVRETTAVLTQAVVLRLNRKDTYLPKVPRSGLIDKMRQDFKYAFRTLLRSPGFALIAVLTLALGIGSNAAIFSVVDSVLLRELPYSNPEELVLVWNTSTGSNAYAPNSGPAFVDYRERANQFDGFSALWAEKTNLTGYGSSDLVTVAHATADFFDLLGVTPHLGRFFVEGDDNPIDNSTFTDPNAVVPPSVLVLSYGFWQTKFAGDPDVIGRSLHVDGAPLNIVGVAPPEFDLFLPESAGIPMGIQAWKPLVWDYSTSPREGQFLSVVARVKDGVTVEQAQSEMSTIAAQLRDEYQFHSEGGIDIKISSITTEAVGGVRPILIALLAAAGLVLLIASSNVANLMLLRVAGRERELAVRTALGSSGWRITSLLLAESGILAAFSAVAGVFVAVGGIRLLLWLKPDNLPRIDTVGIDGRVLGFALFVTLLSSVLVVAIPAIRIGGGKMFDALKEGARGTSSGKHKVQGALVITQVALSVVLLVSTALILRSFVLLKDIDPGFEAKDLVTVSASLPFYEYRDYNSRAEFYERVLDRVREIPGVEAAGGTAVLPLAEGNGIWVTPYATEAGDDESWNRNKASYRLIVPGYFEAIGTRLLQGRPFRASDNQNRETVVTIIDEKLANELWPEGDALGKTIYVGQFQLDDFTLARVPAQVIGIAENVRHTSIYEEGSQTIYVPHMQWTDQRVTVVMRTTMSPADAGQAVTDIVQGMNPNVPVFAVRDMEEFVARAMASTQFVLTLGIAFAIVALVLASVGLFGIVSYLVKQRTREIGIRMAFGAEPGDVVKLVLSHGLKLSGAGVAIGLLVSFLSTSALRSQLFGVNPADPISFGGSAILLITVSLVACYLPARRASVTDPKVALAEE